MSVYKSSQQILSRQFTVSQFFKARKASTKRKMGWLGERASEAREIDFFLLHIES